MDRDKLIQMQYQMRENQQDFSDFVSDLDQWEKDVKKKDESLKNTPKIQENQPELPPVRNSLNQKKKKKKKKVDAEKKDKPAKPKRINSYDYRSWDKFVKEECEGENEKSDKSSSSEYETDEEWEEHRKKQQAVVEKDQGNQFFKERKYGLAIECYSRGIGCDPTNVLLPANRAMALLKQEKYAAAETDCTTAISLDPTYVKAFSRRGTARLALNKLKEAQDDFMQVLKLDPTNKQAKTEIENIDKKLNPAPFSCVTDDSGVVKAIYKPPSQRSKKPLVRISIEEIGVEDDAIKKAIAAAEASQSHTKQQVTAKDSQMFEHYISVDSKTHATTESNTVAHSDLKLDLGNIDKDTEDSENVSEETKEIRKSKQRDRIKSPVETSPTSSPRVPSAPQTSYQFQTDCKILEKHDEKFYLYIKQIEPSLYPKLLGQALDSDILMRMLNTYKNYCIPANIDIFQQLKSLAEVKRFSMIVMFMSSKEKDVIRELFKYIRSGAHCTTDVEKLEKNYEI